MWPEVGALFGGSGSWCLKPCVFSPSDLQDHVISCQVILASVEIFIGHQFILAPAEIFLSSPSVVLCLSACQLVFLQILLHFLPLSILTKGYHHHLHSPVLFVILSVCPSFCLSVRLSVCPSVHCSCMSQPIKFLS